MLPTGPNWSIAVTAAIWLRADLALGWLPPPTLLAVVAAVVLAQVVVGHAVGLYRGRQGYGSAEEVVTLVGVATLAALAIGAPMLVVAPALGIPRTALVIGAPIALLLMASMRYALRILLESAHRPTPTAQPALILGAGYAGTHLVRRMRTDEKYSAPISRVVPAGIRRSPFTPVS